MVVLVPSWRYVEVVAQLDVVLWREVQVDRGRSSHRADCLKGPNWRWTAGLVMVGVNVQAWAQVKMTVGVLVSAIINGVCDETCWM